LSELSADEITSANRYFAIECNNRFWALSESDLGAEERQELLAIAFASLYHWSQVGTDENINLANMAVARALCINEYTQSVEYAEKVHRYFNEDGADWIQAFTNAVLSHALFIVGKTSESIKYYEKAVILQAKLSEGDRKVFDATFSTIPVPRL